MDRVFSVEEIFDPFWANSPATSAVAAGGRNGIHRSPSEWFFERFLEEEAAVAESPNPNPNPNPNPTNPCASSSVSSNLPSGKREGGDDEVGEIRKHQIPAVGAMPPSSSVDLTADADPSKYAAILKQKLDSYCHAVAIARGSGIKPQDSSLDDSRSPATDCSQLGPLAPVTENGSKLQTSRDGGPSGIPALSAVQNLGPQGRPATSGSSREQSHDDYLEGNIEMTDNMDPAYAKRTRRRLSNRESARRSRRGKQAHLSELESQVSQLRAENSALLKRLSDINQKYIASSVDNTIRKAYVETSRAKQKLLDAAMNDINNSFGGGSVTRLGSAGGALVETFPSGCLTLDFALGGGLPKGRIVEIFGPESSGKTTLALHAIAEVQKLGGNAMLVDAEHAFDPSYSRALGVDIENLIVCQPDHGEMALEIADRMCRSGAIDLICIDSVSALTPRAEIEGEIGMQQMGLQARLMSQALRKMSGNASKAGCTLIFLNQIRYKIGVYYGNPEVTSGGIALKFFASLRLEIRPTGKIKSAKGDEDIGVRVRVRVQKSKVSRPYKQAEFEIMFGEGVSQLGCVLDCAELMDIVAKKGSWYSYGEHRLGQGRDKALQYLKEHPLLVTEIEKAVRGMVTEGSSHMSLIASGQSSTAEEEGAYEER